MSAFLVRNQEINLDFSATQVLEGPVLANFHDLDEAFHRVGNVSQRTIFRRTAAPFPQEMYVIEYTMLSIFIDFFYICIKFIFPLK